MKTNDKLSRASERLQRVSDGWARRGFAAIILLGLAAGGILGGVLGAALAALSGMR
jgi:hypothetical protein